MKVSVLMSVYNGEKYLKEAIESILQQSFTGFEFLIMDDGSTDSSKEIIRKQQAVDNRITMYSQANAGLAESLNKLIRYSCGEYIARMDADDISHSDRLGAQVRYLDQYRSIGMVATSRHEIAPNGMIFATYYLPDNEKEIVEMLNEGENPIAHGSVMLRSNILNSLKQVPYRTRVSQDLDLWIRISKLTTIGVIKAPLYKLRRTSDAISMKTLDIKKQVHQFIYKSNSEMNEGCENINSMISDHINNNSINKNIAYDAYLNAKALFRNMRYLDAMREFVRLLEHAQLRKPAIGFILLCALGKYGLWLHSKLNPNAFVFDERRGD